MNHAVEKHGTGCSGREPTNDERADWAEIALRRFGSVVGLDLDLEPEVVLSDLLCDLMHWATRENIEFALASLRACSAYTEERQEESA